MASPTVKISDLKINITAKGVGKRFNREWIFKKLDYTFQTSNTYAITGPNGSGKSTLLQVLWGQLPQTSGELKYTTTSGDIPVDEIFKHLAIATPYVDLIEEFTLLEHLKFHIRLKPSRNGMTEVEMMERMKLTHARDKPISNFSSGMRQRVRLALAFFTQADLLFLDEPTTNLDSETTEWYHHELSQIPSTCTTFIASNLTTEYPSNAHVINILDFK